jgi:hypothetical protein
MLRAASRILGLKEKDLDRKQWGISAVSVQGVGVYLYRFAIGDVASGAAEKSGRGSAPSEECSVTKRENGSPLDAAALRGVNREA